MASVFKNNAEESSFESAEPLTCARFLSARLHTIKPRESVTRARALLEKHRINQLPVVEDGVLVGIVTDRDLRDAVNAITTSAHSAGTTERTPETADETPIDMVMSHNAITLAPHSTIITAAELMRRERIGSVPIVDGQKLVGIVTRGDILEAFVDLQNRKTGKPARGHD
jgi:acetoin utilization protein AcuB